ncbi:hypothetical protein L6164_025515 [Bauhinia variegata]|uniref:Uncharacterized protein n=1 Tax=Bauhinia variegata TaxID=167791 RepID=A0ACB9M2J7_BAUVA|nr:hypothetical protein L6164_025515 [Bauhinia variegata]
MECNKEEAVRAKSIALMKMESRDFTGAQKLARKAQQLYPDLENIAQMLVVCDVHCSAEQKLFGNEMDWYGILQIEQTANEATIKKQYRKLALLLHPDKNKFAGAEAAFKLIGEASRVLTDRDKRALHDIKRRSSMNKPAVSHRPPQKAYTDLNAGMQNNVRNNFTNIYPQHQQFRHQGQQGPKGEHPEQQQSRQQGQQGPNVERPPHQQSRQPGQQSNGERATFWTVCPFCSVKYQYYTEILNKYVRCQSCGVSFVAINVNVQVTSPATNTNTENSSKEPLKKKGLSSYTVSGNMNGKKKRKKTAESSESSDSIGSTDSEEDVVTDEAGIFSEQNHSTHREENPRRSARQKQQVSYNENRSDDEDNDLKSSKRPKGSESPCVTEESCRKAANIKDQNVSAADWKDDQKETKEEHNIHSKESLPNRNEETKDVSWRETVGGSRKVGEDSEHYAEDPKVLEYPDSEFNDFERDKREECFAAGQTWAIYDITEGMPRFYAVIKKVLSPGFKVEITWFEPDPIDEDERRWVEEELPVSCGRFRPGGTEISDAHSMFSHLIYCEATGRGKKARYKVYPRKGETWALFKNWDIKWYADVESHRDNEYEFVEIMSDYVGGNGVSVAYLAKLKGFVSLFFQVVKEGNNSFQIPSRELFRFSHRVPSFKMTGQERAGVPRGSYELDPASLPLNIEEIDAPEGLERKVSPSGSVNMSSSDRLKPMVASDGDDSNGRRSNFVKENKGSVVDFEDCSSAHSVSTQEAVEIPDPQFHDFDADRSQKKFRIGQIWAFYSDEDAMPKYYGHIDRIVTSPDLNLHISWLASCDLPKNTIRWEKDKEMLVSCGRFKIFRKNSNVYNSLLSISHQVRADTDGRNNVFSIFPRKGEVWALYKNWTADMIRDDLLNCQYDIVEVLHDSDLWYDVLVLERVGGYNSVFKGKSNNGSVITWKIPKTELLRFSHKIPAFKLTEKHGNGNLRGFWELDPPALPMYYFGSS